MATATRLRVDSMVYFVRLRTLRAYLTAGYYAQASAQFKKYNFDDNCIPVLPPMIDNAVKVHMLMADIMLGLDMYAESIEYINNAITLLEIYVKQQLLVIRRLLFGGEFGSLDKLDDACKYLIAQELCNSI